MNKVEEFVEQIIKKLEDGEYTYQDKSFKISLDKMTVAFYLRLHSTPEIAYYYVSDIQCTTESGMINISLWDFDNKIRWKLDKVAEKTLEMEENKKRSEYETENKKQIIDFLDKSL